MKLPSLDEHLQDYFEAEAPSPQLLERLVAATRDAEPETVSETPVAAPADRSPRSVLVRFLWAATLVIAVGGALLVQSRLTTAKTARSVAAEIVMNHVKNLDVEIRATTWSELRQGLDKLDFALAASSRLEERGLRLRGGRYCSIQGKLAAQIQIVDPGGDRLTLYQTATTSDLGDLDRILSASGVEVEMWNERGLFFGLAQPSAE